MRKFLRGTAVCLAVLATSLTTYANSITDIQEDKKDKESKKAEAQAVLDSLEAEHTDILETIAVIDGQIAEYTAQINDLNAQKAELEISIANNQAELDAAKATEEAQYEAMKLRIQYSYENGSVEYVDTVFTTSDMADIVNQSEYVEQIYNYDANMLSDLIEIRTTVANKQLELQADLDAVELIESQVAENLSASEYLLDAKMEQSASYESSIEDYENQISLFEQDIAALDAQIAELEAAARQQAAASGQAPTVYYTGGAFQWPVAGNGGGTITSHYGPRWGRMHQGIDIGCPTGTPIVAGESGTVLTSAYSSSMGNYVLIDHGGGVTTVYMHNSSLCVSAGQYVERGQLIAYAGSTGRSTGPHCHFGLRINGSYVDPYPYLTN